MQEPGEEDCLLGDELFFAGKSFQSIPYFTRAANLDYPPAFLRLARIYRSGDMGVPMEKKRLPFLFLRISENFDWFKQKAKTTQKAVDFFNLGLIYEYKQAKHQNLKKSIKYYTLAANLNHARAQCNLGVLHQHGTDEKDSIDVKSATHFYQLAANQGDVFGLCNLGLSYLEGEGIEFNEEKGLLCLQQAADKGFSRAQYFLGTCYTDGTGTQKDPTKSLELFRKSAENGFPYAQVALGEHYYEGGELIQALEWYRKAADQGEGWGMYLVGYLCEIEGLAKGEGKKWFEMSADSGEKTALDYVEEGYVVGSRTGCLDVMDTCLVLIVNLRDPPSLLPELWTKILHSLVESQTQPSSIVQK